MLSISANHGVLLTLPLPLILFILSGFFISSVSGVSFCAQIRTEFLDANAQAPNGGKGEEIYSEIQNVRIFACFRAKTLAINSCLRFLA
jgi:hypothetical protein